jgi:hypothetical protein
LRGSGVRPQAGIGRLDEEREAVVSVGVAPLIAARFVPTPLGLVRPIGRDRDLVVSGGVLWANLHLLFWLSLIPFTTGWMGENHFAQWPVVLYGFNLLACALAYTILQTLLVRHHGHELLKRAVAGDKKGKSSLLLYVAGIAAAWFGWPMVGLAFFVVVAAIWLVPDTRIERVLYIMPAQEAHRAVIRERLKARLAALEGEGT